MAQLDDLQAQLCSTLLAANLTTADGNSTSVALEVVQDLVCANGTVNANFNLTALTSSVEGMLASASNITSANVSTILDQLFTDPVAAVNTLVSLLGLGSGNGTANATSAPQLSLTQLQPIIQAIQNDPAAAKQLPALLPLFLALASGNNSALQNIDWTALAPVLQAIWNDPAARAEVPQLLPYLEQALGGAVQSSTGSGALGSLVSALLGGLTNVASPLLDVIFGTPGAAAPAPSAG